MKNIDLEQIRQLLDNPARCIEYYDYLLERFYSDDDSADECEGELHQALIDLLRQFFITELQEIARISESPIERLFCTSILMCGRTRDIDILRFTPAVGDKIEEYQQWLRSWVRGTEEFEVMLKKQGGNPLELKRFTEYLVEKRDMDREQATGLGYFQLVYSLFGFKNAFHISQQPQLPSSVKIDGRRVRPDMYVWLPLNESYRLLVECDGYSYHSDKESFTRDRKRDRILKRSGYDVLRFSGAEIHHDPLNVAVELVDYLRSQRQIG